MTGRGLAVTERDRAILREIARVGVMTRDQLMRLRVFGSKTRANTRLKRLVDHGYLVARPQPLVVGGPRYVYVPGPQSGESRDARTRVVAASDLFLAHQLGLVDIRLTFEQHTTLSRWLAEKDLAGLSLGLVPDAYLEYAIDTRTVCAFIEYDRGTETLGRVERKVRLYLDLAHSGRFERTFTRTFFRVLVVTDTAGRLATLSQTTARLTDRVLRFTTMAELTHDGPLASIWRRPGVITAESLIPS
jgi:hypothetical protein